MGNDKAMARAALERDLQRHRARPTASPRRGWIRAIRDALGMSTNEMTRRMGVSKARIGQIERGERERSITLDTLHRAAEALNCRVEYVLVPLEPLDDLVWAQARAKAQAEIGSIDHTMALEDQRPARDATEASIETAARHHLDRRGLWS